MSFKCAKRYLSTLLEMILYTKLKQKRVKLMKKVSLENVK